MGRKHETLRPTDDTARKLARRLLRGARFGALAVIEPCTGEPFASRVLLGIDIDGAAVTLVSSLSRHTKGLEAGTIASLLVGQPGKGDPLAHPRLTVQCRPVRVVRDTVEGSRIRHRFIRRHPKAETYVDFGDFAFFRLEPVRASLNGGFGKAYELAAGDLAIESPAVAEIAVAEARILDQMNSDHSDAVRTYVTDLAHAETGRWVMCGLDAAGFDVQSEDRLERIEFENALRSAAEISDSLIRMLDLPH